MVDGVTGWYCIVFFYAHILVQNSTAQLSKVEVTPTSYNGRWLKLSLGVAGVVAL